MKSDTNGRVVGVVGLNVSIAVSTSAPNLLHEARTIELHFAEDRDVCSTHSLTVPVKRSSFKQVCLGVATTVPAVTATRHIPMAALLIKTARESVNPSVGTNGCPQPPPLCQCRSAAPSSPRRHCVSHRHWI